MNVAIYSVLSALFGASFCANLYLLNKLKKVKAAPVPTYDVQEFIHDLTAGVGLVQITRIAPANVLLRSPRDL